jgi:hypothetical protein
MIMRRTPAAAALVLLACGCAHRGDTSVGQTQHPTFHYATQSAPAKLGAELRGTLDPQRDDRFAQGFRFHCPAAGTLRAEADAAPEGTELRLALFKSGAKPLASTENERSVEARVESAGPCYLVVSLALWSWEATFHARAMFVPDTAPTTSAH